jgi:hypothetical protein
LSKIETLFTRNGERGGGIEGKKWFSVTRGVENNKNKIVKVM